MTKFVFNFQYHKHNLVGIKDFWYEFVKHVLYFVESAAAFNRFLYFC